MDQKRGTKRKKPDDGDSDDKSGAPTENDDGGGGDDGGRGGGDDGGGRAPAAGAAMAPAAAEAAYERIEALIDGAKDIETLEAVEAKLGALNDRAVEKREKWQNMIDKAALDKEMAAALSYKGDGAKQCHFCKNSFRDEMCEDYSEVLADAGYDTLGGSCDICHTTYFCVKCGYDLNGGCSQCNSHACKSCMPAECAVCEKRTCNNCLILCTGRCKKAVCKWNPRLIDGGGCLAAPARSRTCTKCVGGDLPPGLLTDGDALFERANELLDSVADTDIDERYFDFFCKVGCADGMIMALWWIAAEGGHEGAMATVGTALLNNKWHAETRRAGAYWLFHEAACVISDATQVCSPETETLRCMKTAREQAHVGSGESRTNLTTLDYGEMAFERGGSGAANGDSAVVLQRLWYTGRTTNLRSWDPTLSRFVRRGLFYLVRLLKNGNVVAIEDSGVKQVRSVPPLAPPPAPEGSQLAATINALREGPLSHEDRERLEAEGHDCGVGYYGERRGWIGEWIKGNE